MFSAPKDRAAFGVPDGRGGAPTQAVDETDLLRARLWSLLGALLAAPPSADLLRQVAQLGGDNSPLGVGLSDLAQHASQTNEVKLEREYHHLFIGVVRGELVPYASFYITGFLNEKPLARLRADMEALGIARADGASDPEDHIAGVAEMMAGLIAGEFRVPTERQQRFFERHIQSWAGRFFGDLERTDAASFYRPVGTVGRLFVEIEADAYRLAA